MVAFDLGKHRCGRTVLLSGILLLSVPGISGQTKETAPSGILFAALPPPTEPTEDGRQALPTVDPIAFITAGQIHDCFDRHGNIPPDELGALRRIYAPGHSYSLWSGGHPVGGASSVSSCIDEDGLANGGEVDLEGCFQFRANSQQPVGPDFSGSVWTGKKPAPSHAASGGTPDAAEVREFARLASAAFTSDGYKGAVSSVHTVSLRKTMLRPDHPALAGSAWVQAATGTGRDYLSLRAFLVAEEEGGRYRTVLVHRHKATVTLDQNEPAPKPGEELDEENQQDKETFVDNFPLFPSEPDVILSRHEYYESSQYSIYRRAGADYRLVYTGCGGGT